MSQPSDRCTSNFLPPIWGNASMGHYESPPQPIFSIMGVLWLFKKQVPLPEGGADTPRWYNSIVFRVVAQNQQLRRVTLCFKSSLAPRCLILLWCLVRNYGFCPELTEFSQFLSYWQLGFFFLLTLPRVILSLVVARCRRINWVPLIQSWSLSLTLTSSIRNLDPNYHALHHLKCDAIVHSITERSAKCRWSTFCDTRDCTNFLV